MRTLNWDRTWAVIDDTSPVDENASAENEHRLRKAPERKTVTLKTLKSAQKQFTPTVAFMRLERHQSGRAAHELNSLKISLPS